MYCQMSDQEWEQDLHSPIKEHFNLCLFSIYNFKLCFIMLIYEQVIAILSGPCH